MDIKTLLVLLSATILLFCCAPVNAVFELPIDHPANENAPVSPRGARSTILQIDENKLKEKEPLPRRAGHEHRQGTNK